MKTRSFRYPFILLLLMTFFWRCAAYPDPSGGFFNSAEPVWPAGLQYEMNITTGFVTSFEKPASSNLLLRLAGSSIYRIFLNGCFIGHGPARAGHGYYRVDEWDLAGKLREGTNVLAIEAAGYNINSYYLLDQPSFIQAEVVSGNRIIAATSPAGNDFRAILIDERVQKVPRYSFQRTFTEYYTLEPGYDNWRLLQGEGLNFVECESAGEKALLERRIPYPEFNIIMPKTVVSKGQVKTGIKRERYWRDRAVVDIGENLKGFPEADLELNPAIEIQQMENVTMELAEIAYSQNGNYHLGQDHFMIFDLGVNQTGFIGGEIEVTRGGRLYLTFDEILTDGDVNFSRMGTINSVTYDLQPGTYVIESIEPYTLRYLKAIMTGGECTVNGLYMREYVNPDIKRASFKSSDERINRIFEAGVETFRQNALDIYMDCPSRERAGWLCDSYFMARVEMDLSGNTLIEKNFYENFLLPEEFKFLPEGMLPMCYPADHYNGNFIPNWAMWFVIQLKEYLERSNDHELVGRLRDRVLGLIGYFEPFKNEDGLLENLERWIFIEWSEANNFVQDVNYPTNMLFAATLEVAGELYGIAELQAEAAAIRETIRKQAFNGDFFVDNAVRDENGILVVTENTTEVCQYYAFFFGTATPQSHPGLWDKLVNEFGPDRRQNNPYPMVYFANAFIGNYLRLELLSRNNLHSQILDESIDFFHYMAERTGTLWENITTHASLNHGFASHVVHILYRDVLGVAERDINNRKITFRIPDIGLSHCSGKIPIGDEVIEFEWEKSDEVILVRYTVPEGYEYVIENETGRRLERALHHGTGNHP
jgi:alpha-L-rhamnosidase